MSDKIKLTALFLLSLGLIALFLFDHLGGNWDYVLPRRTAKILAMVLTGSAIAFSTVIFQTITNNRILTPSIIGLDSLYLFIQTFVVYVFGSATLALMNSHVHFLISVGLMVLFSVLLYQLLFRREGRNIYFLLLAGIVFGTFFRSMASFMQMLIDPNEFMIVQDRMFASFNNINTDLLFISVIVMAGISVYFSRYAKYLDVLALGREHAVNLGVAYETVVLRLLMMVAALVSISTALVGPITFLGLLVANVTYQFIRTYRHQYVIPGSMLISIVALVGGQWLIERIFAFTTTISVMINFIGGITFLYLLLRENKA
jgi:iron complex transport system permease protein